MKTKDYKFKIGQRVYAGNPLEEFHRLPNMFIVEQIKPFTYPVIETSRDIVRLPRTRKEIRTTREISYLIAAKNPDDPTKESFYVWATERCIKDADGVDTRNNSREII